jgi:cell division septation protein DedD
MQDIDFSRYYRKGRRTYPAAEASEARRTGAPVNKLSLYLAIAFSSLAIGFIGGTQLQKHKMMRELENRVAPQSAQNETVVTANVAADPTDQTDKASGTVRTTRPQEPASGTRAPQVLEGSYLILAKIYPDEKEASLAGLNLKRSGLNAFMARNGRKVKLYVGPIEGRAQAYEVLAQVKKNPEFSGAILYRK